MSRVRIPSAALDFHKLTESVYRQAERRKLNENLIPSDDLFRIRHEGFRHMWYVYLLQCVDGSFYTGLTNDLDKRVITHNKGLGAKFTSGKGPVELVYYEKMLDKKSALKREVVIKGFSRKNKRHLINYPSGDRVSLVTGC